MKLTRKDKLLVHKERIWWHKRAFKLFLWEHDVFNSTLTESSKELLTVLGFVSGGKIEAEMFNLLLMFNKGTNVCFSTKTPLLQNRCYVPFFFGI